MTPCTMGVGCDEAGICFAAAHDEPDRCPLREFNQCDGCRIKAPLTPMGNHRYPDGSLIGCTKKRYET